MSVDKPLCPKCGKPLSSVCCPHCRAKISKEQRELLRAVCMKSYGTPSRGHQPIPPDNGGEAFAWAVACEQEGEHDLRLYLAQALVRAKTFYLPATNDGREGLIKAFDDLEEWIENVRFAFDLEQV